MLPIYIYIYIYMYIYIYHTLRVFYTGFSWWTFTKVWMTASFLKILSTQADLNSAEVWMVSILPWELLPSVFFPKPFGTVPTALITISINVTFMFHSFFTSSDKIQVSVYLFAFFYFHSVTRWKSKNQQTCFFSSCSLTP